MVNFSPQVVASLCVALDVPSMLPVNLTSWDPTPSQAVILSDVADLGLLHVVPWVGTHVATASLPCPPWSRAGEQDGLADPQGMYFVDAVAWGRVVARGSQTRANADTAKTTGGRRAVNRTKETDAPTG